MGKDGLGDEAGNPQFYPRDALLLEPLPDSDDHEYRVLVPRWQLRLMHGQEERRTVRHRRFFSVRCCATWTRTRARLLADGAACNAQFEAMRESNGVTPLAVPPAVRLQPRQDFGGPP
jgi:hypothetical protein